MSTRDLLEAHQRLLGQLPVRTHAQRAPARAEVPQ